MSEFAPGAPQRGAFSFGGARAKPNLIDKIESEEEDGWASAGGRRGWMRLRFRQWMRGVAGLHRSFPEPDQCKRATLSPEIPQTRHYRGLSIRGDAVAYLGGEPPPAGHEARDWLQRQRLAAARSCS